ncbi:MAG: hypothetical protein V3U24_03120 [Candidatus Neomarinimicrobiota bacterium]
MPDLDDLKALESYFAHHFDSVLFPVLAEHYRERKDFPRAQKVLEIGFGYHPGFIPGLYVQAKIHLAEEDLKSAEEVSKRIIALDPRHYQAHLLLAEVQEKLGRAPSTLRRRYREILDIHPGDDRAREGLEKPKTVPRKAGPAGDLANLSISPRMATFTLMAILKSQKLYDQALDVLTAMSRKEGADTERIDRERKELLILLKVEVE